MRHILHTHQVISTVLCTVNRPGFKFPLTPMRCLALVKLFTLRDLFLFATYYDQQKDINNI